MSNDNNGKVIANLIVRLFVVGVVAAAVLGKVADITAEPIAEQARLAEENGMMAVLPDGENFEFLVDLEGDEAIGADLVEGTSIRKIAKSDAGYVLTAYPSGFGGEIRLMVGIGADGVIQGVRILSHAETAGLGAKSTEPVFYEQYNNLSGGNFAVQKDGGNIVAITGATITSRAVTAGVNEAYDWFVANGGAD